MDKTSVVLRHDFLWCLPLKRLSTLVSAPQLIGYSIFYVLNPLVTINRTRAALFLHSGLRQNADFNAHLEIKD